jgi:hypothetical protein
MSIQSITFASFPAAGSAVDSAAVVNAFKTATGISDTTIENALLDLVDDIAAISSGDVWTNKLKLIYPMVGGTAATHAVNLRNPGTHDGTMNGTITHNANGVTGNGTTGYIDTNFNQSTHGADDDEHISIYSRTDLADNSHVLTVMNGLGNGTILLPKGASNTFISRSQDNISNTVAVTDSLGYFSVNRTSSTGYRKRQNGTNTNVTQSGTQAPLNLNFYLLARNNNGSAASWTTRNIAWAAIGRGLTESEDAALMTAVETFQDALSRGVV